MAFLWNRGIIFRESVTHAKNHLFTFCRNIAAYLTLMIFCYYQTYLREL